MPAIELLLGALVVGGSVFYGIAVAACLRLTSRTVPEAPPEPPKISMIKALAGARPDSEALLETAFQFDYPRYELLLTVRHETDAATAVARRLIERYPRVDARIVVAGEPPSIEQYPNSKNWSLLQASKQATGEILIVSDDDIRAEPDQLQALAAEFADDRVGVVTLPYRAAPGDSFWSVTEAIGMNTEFWSGAFTAWFLGPMDFAVGPTMAIRRSCLDELGGFESTRDYLAEDFVLGNRARKLGWEVELGRHVVEHRIGAQGFRANWRHRLRWYRSTRRSRPAGYVAQVFTYPLPFAVVLAATGQAWSVWLLAGCAVMRLAAALATARVLEDQLVMQRLYLLPLQDALSFVVWIGGFFGRTIQWRDWTFELLPDGRTAVRRGPNEAVDRAKTGL